MPSCSVYSSNLHFGHISVNSLVLFSAFFPLPLHEWVSKRREQASACQPSNQLFFLSFAKQVQVHSWHAHADNTIFAVNGWPTISFYCYAAYFKRNTRMRGKNRLKFPAGYFHKQTGFMLLRCISWQPALQISINFVAFHCFNIPSYFFFDNNFWQGFLQININQVKPLINMGLKFAWMN